MRGLPNGTRTSVAVGLAGGKATLNASLLAKDRKKAGCLARLKYVSVEFRLIPRNRRPSQGYYPLRRH